ncbi:MAG: hypothetical protein AAB382_02880 [Chloroflexota bacterium]
MNDLKIWKAILEIRFPAAASIFDSRGKIAAKWQWTSDFSEWQISNNQVTIHNKANTTFLRAGFRNVVIVMEMPQNYKAFLNQALDFSTWTLDTLQVKKAERIGLRLIQIAERKHFKLLVSTMRQRLFRLSDEDWSVIGGHPEDIGLPLTLSLGENKANFSLGPMKKEQLVDLFESSEVKDKLPLVALFLDFDLYQHDPKALIELSQESLSLYLKSGGEQILDLSAKFVSRFGGFE